jgi:hypothetical protein
VYHSAVLAIAISILLQVVQATHAGTIVGIVKLPNSDKPLPAARVVLLPPKYVEVWNRQMQTRLDNYWEIFKPEFAANKQAFLEFDRIVQVEAFQYVTTTMRRELGEGASKLIKESSPSGQFEFSNVPFGSYQLLVQSTVKGQDVIWSKTVDVQSDIPIFVDLGKPVS